MIRVKPVLLFRCLSGSHCIFKAGETSKPTKTVTSADLRGPFLPIRFPVNASHAASVIPIQNLVPHVLFGSDRPEIEETIVCPVSVDVVDLFWEESEVVEPDKPVSGVGAAPKMDARITRIAQLRRCFLAGETGIPGVALRLGAEPTFAISEPFRVTFLPKQLPGLGVVVEKFSDYFFRQFHRLCIRSWFASGRIPLPCWSRAGGTSRREGYVSYRARH